MIFLLDVFQLLDYDVVVGEVPLDAGFVLGSNVRAAKDHEGVNVIASVEQQAAYRAVRDLVFRERNGPEMQEHKLLDKLHFVVQRQLHALEDFGYHASTLVFMSVKRPAVFALEAFGGWLCNVMKDGRPTQPKVIRDFRHIIQYFQGVVEIVLVTNSVSPLYSFECLHLREDDAQQSTLVEQFKSNRRPWAQDDLVKLGVDSLLADDLHAVGVLLYGCDVGVCDAEVKLGGEPNRTQHPQWVVTERDIRIQRRLNALVLQVSNASKGVNEVTERRLI